MATVDRDGVSCVWRQPAGVTSDILVKKLMLVLVLVSFSSINL